MNALSMLGHPASSADNLLRAARGLEPIVLANRDALEADRRLPPAVVEALAEADLFRLWVPKSLGGHEVDVATLIRVIEEVSRLDGAVGWCATVAAAYGRMSGYLRPDVSRAIFSSRQVAVGGTVSTSGEAVVAPGGYRVNGRWSFGSGINHSAWVVATCMTLDGGAPRRHPDGSPDFRIVIVPVGDCEIIDNWRTCGLRGTGSHDYVIRDVFVPEERSVAAFSPSPTYGGALYAFPFISALSVSIAAVPLGIARRAIDELIALASTKTPAGAPALLRERQMVQADIGRAEALLRSARAFLFEAVGELWEAAEAGNATSMNLRAAVRLACANAATSAAQAVDLMYAAGGGTSLRVSCPIERCFRDVHATTQHIAVNGTAYDLAGRVLLGMPPGMPTV